jgi:hypothetical protein
MSPKPERCTQEPCCAVIGGDQPALRTALRGERLYEAKRAEEHKRSDDSHTNLTFRVFHAKSKR